MVGDDIDKLLEKEARQPSDSGEQGRISIFSKKQNVIVNESVVYNTEDKAGQLEDLFIITGFFSVHSDKIVPLLEEQKSGSVVNIAVSVVNGAIYELDPDTGITELAESFSGERIISVPLKPSDPDSFGSLFSFWPKKRSVPVDRFNSDCFGCSNYFNSVPVDDPEITKSLKKYLNGTPTEFNDGWFLGDNTSPVGMDVIYRELVEKNSQTLTIQKEIPVGDDIYKAKVQIPICMIIPVNEPLTEDIQIQLGDVLSVDKEDKIIYFATEYSA